MGCFMIFWTKLAVIFSSFSISSLFNPLICRLMVHDYGNTKIRAYVEGVLTGSLTGAVSSQKVTEERDGTLSMDGNHADSAKA